MGRRTGKTQKKPCPHCQQLIGVAGFAIARHLKCKHPEVWAERERRKYLNSRIVHYLSQAPKPKP